MAFDHGSLHTRELLRYTPEAVAMAASFVFVMWCLL